MGKPSSLLLSLITRDLLRGNSRALSRQAGRVLTEQHRPASQRCLLQHPSAGPLGLWSSGFPRALSTPQLWTSFYLRNDGVSWPWSPYRGNRNTGTFPISPKATDSLLGSQPTPSCGAT